MIQFDLRIFSKWVETQPVAGGAISSHTQLSQSHLRWHRFLLMQAACWMSEMPTGSEASGRKKKGEEHHKLVALGESQGHPLHPWNLTWNLKRIPWKRWFLLETIIFRCHVKFRGSSRILKCNLKFSCSLICLCEVQWSAVYPHPKRNKGIVSIPLGAQNEWRPLSYLNDEQSWCFFYPNSSSQKRVQLFTYICFGNGLCVFSPPQS